MLKKRERERERERPKTRHIKRMGQDERIIYKIDEKGDYNRNPLTSYPLDSVLSCVWGKKSPFFPSPCMG